MNSAKYRNCPNTKSYYDSHRKWLLCICRVGHFCHKPKNLKGMDTVILCKGDNLLFAVLYTYFDLKRNLLVLRKKIFHTIGTMLQKRRQISFGEDCLSWRLFIANKASTMNFLADKKILVALIEQNISTICIAFIYLVVASGALKTTPIRNNNLEW